MNVSSEHTIIAKRHISIGEVGADSVFVGELRVIQISIRIEFIVVWILCRIMVQCPDRSKNDAVFRNMFAFIFIVLSSRVRIKNRDNLERWTLPCVTK